MPLSAGVRRLPLDDLTRMAELVGDARVVAIGENNHYIREFTQLRTRILRLLVTELGFGVLGFESGFAEGRLVDEWIRGAPGDVAAVAGDGFTFRYGEPPEMREMLEWLRAHNASGGRVHFAGLDVPGSGGSPLPALHRVRDHLAAHSPEELPLVETAIETTSPYQAANNGAAPARYAALDAPARDAATAALTRLLLRMDALAPGADPRAHRIARHHALGALRLDEQLRELSELATRTGTGPAVLASSRDVYQADTVRLLRELHGPAERIVLMLHNAHIQRVPPQLLPGVRIRSAGSYLAAELGPDYVALGVTARDGSTTETELDERARLGFTVRARPLPPLTADSVERQADGDTGVLLDLRAARGGDSQPASIRFVAGHMPVDPPAAFDGLACLPTMTASALADYDDQPEEVS